MMRGLWTAASGMAAQQMNLDVVSNNLANVNTTGFKKARAEFQDLMYQRLRDVGSATGDGARVPVGIEVGLGARTSAIQKIFTPGASKDTGNQTDVAIEGDGFFQVDLPNGTKAYTRDGAFKLDDQGRFVNADGYLLNPNIAIDANAESIAIGPDGTVMVKLFGGDAPQTVGQIRLYRFVNPAGLSSMGHNLFMPTAASGPATEGTAGTDGFGTLAQSRLEISNVSVVEEMVSMIVAQRAYETNSKAIQASDEMLSMANQLRR